MNQTQYIINKLISEEVLAFETYKTIILNFTDNDKQTKSFIEMINELAEDEYDDHAKKLIKYCIKNNLEYPFDNADYIKFAGVTSKRCFKTIPHTNDPAFLLAVVLELEKDACMTYAQIINELERCESMIPEELYNIIVHNYKDEQEHLERVSVAIASLVKVI